jgi:hypothetical protein
LLWARVAHDYWGYDLLRARGAQSVGVIPPIPFALVEQNRRDTDLAFDQAWARTYAQMLNASDLSPLSEGLWHLGHHGSSFSVRDLNRDLIRKIVDQKQSGFIEWDFGLSIYPITLRDLSDPQSGRVKAWRKHARAGTMPPVLLYWVSGLDAYVVLDGHDRLLAASLEDVGAPALSLEPLRAHEIPQSAKDAIFLQVSKSLASADIERSRSPGDRLARALRLMDVDRANELLLNAFVPELLAGPSRAQVLPGGIGQWVSEVRDALGHDTAQTPLLEGLAGDVNGINLGA